MSADEGYKPFFPNERREERNGLIVVREGMTPEMRRQRRQDNQEMKRSRAIHRRRKKHGRP